MKYDAIVIGSGQAGNPLCYALAERGWTVTLVEKSNLGGTCINSGCTPTKTMVASAQVAHYARHAMKWGVNTVGITVDLPAIVARKNAVVQSFRSGHQRRIDQHPNLHLRHGLARFISPRQLQDLPYSLFTDPQLGRIGMTEKEARASGRKLKIGAYPMANVARAIERGETAGFMKLIADAETNRILGAAILGIEGGELVQILGALILANAPYTVLKSAVYIHPTLAEGLFGLMEAVKPVV